MAIADDGICEAVFMDIRTEVFFKEQGLIDNPDKIDEVATHLVAFYGGRAISTCRIFRSDDSPDMFIIGRLAVIKKFRGQGVGTQMIAAAERKVAELGGVFITLHSQYKAADFYKNLGYSVCSEIEYEQGQPHVWMIKELAKQKEKIR